MKFSRLLGTFLGAVLVLCSRTFADPTLDTSKVTASAQIGSYDGSALTANKPGLLSFFIANHTLTTLGPNTLPAGKITVLVPPCLVLDPSTASSGVASAPDVTTNVFPPNPTGITIQAVAGGSLVTIPYPALSAMMAARYTIGFTSTVNASGVTIPFLISAGPNGTYTWKMGIVSSLMSPPAAPAALRQKRAMVRHQARKPSRK